MAKRMVAGTARKAPRPRRSPGIELDNAAGKRHRKALPAKLPEALKGESREVDADDPTLVEFLEFYRYEAGRHLLPYLTLVPRRKGPHSQYVRLDLGIGEKTYRLDSRVVSTPGRRMSAGITDGNPSDQTLLRAQAAVDVLDCISSLRVSSRLVEVVSASMNRGMVLQVLAGSKGQQLVKRVAGSMSGGPRAAKGEKFDQILQWWAESKPPICKIHRAAAIKIRKLYAKRWPNDKSPSIDTILRYVGVKK